jgi:hypothetical protein
LECLRDTCQPNSGVCGYARDLPKGKPFEFLRGAAGNLSTLGIIDGKTNKSNPGRARATPPPSISASNPPIFFLVLEKGGMFHGVFHECRPHRYARGPNGIKKPTGRGYQRAYRRGQPDRYRREICIYIPRWATIP